MSAWPIPWLSALPLRWIVSSLMAAGLFLAGYRLGQQGVQQAWDAERMQQKAAALQQSLQVAQVQTRQEQINQRITIDHDTRKTQLQHLWRPQQPSIPAVSAQSVATDQRIDAHSLRKPATNTHGPGPVPAHAEPAAGVDAAAADVVPDPARAQISVTCEQLASDAAQATLMVLSFQRWYAEQTKNLEESR